MNNIRKFRQEKNITLTELSVKAGVSTGYVAHLELGSRNNPSKEVMQNIASALNESVSEVFCLDEFFDEKEDSNGVNS